MPIQEETAPGQFTDADAGAVIVRSARMVAVLALIGLPVAAWRGGWRSALLLLVGAAVSASGLWEWRRLMTALMIRMEPAEGEHMVGAHRPSIGFALAGFFVRLFLVVAVLYVSLRYLNGSALALVAGIAMGVFALTVEGLRLLRSGTI